MPGSQTSDGYWEVPISVIALSFAHVGSQGILLPSLNEKDVTVVYVLLACLYYPAF